ncbi:hypothetical protein PVAND_005610 [Polypedilum vanderplanki]|uniref:Box C/D snoRNA protein 1 n=1 Tax=Polypedilum vanderplanki TaxID=319348 RepID=A0A9J6C0P8_POLVA|nr:hypothetical protein PVAND_005610 [Polypedilum vanderplanki]
MDIENSEIEAEIKKRERFGSCEVCNKNQAKYTCPRCELHTCSLNCSKIHKKELDCNGIRDKTKYIPLSKMTAVDFMNDYYFLEEATRFTKNVKTNSNVKNIKRLSGKFNKLKNAAKARNIRNDRKNETEKQQQLKEKEDTLLTKEVNNISDEDDEISPENYFFSN